MIEHIWSLNLPSVDHLRLGNIWGRIWFIYNISYFLDFVSLIRSVNHQNMSQALCNILHRSVTCHGISHDVSCMYFPKYIRGLFEPTKSWQNLLMSKTLSIIIFTKYDIFHWVVLMRYFDMSYPVLSRAYQKEIKVFWWCNQGLRFSIVQPNN